MNGEDYFIPKMFWKLLVPSLLSSVGFAFADMADALVVGRKMGETGLAAISLCLPVFMLINFFMNGLGIGGSIHYSRLLGMGKKEEANACFNRIWRSALLIGMGIGILGNLFAPQVLSWLGTTPSDGALYAACEEYLRVITFGAPLLMLNIIFSNFLRNDDNAKLAATGFLIGNAVDITLNVVLVLGLNLKTRGAALSTVIGSAVAIVCYLDGILFRKRNLLRFAAVRPRRKETLHCFRIGCSAAVMQLFQLLFFLLANRVLMRLDGENGVAVFDMVCNASFLILYLYNGTAEAMQPLVSTFAGENSRADCRTVLRLAKQYGLCAGGLMAGVVFAAAGQIAGIFGLSEELLEMGAHALRIYCAGFAFVGWNILQENYYQAKEDSRSALVIASLRGCAVLLPCVLLFSLCGIRWIWLFFPVTEAAAAFLFVLYRRERRKKETVFDENRILRRSITKEQQDITLLLAESEAFCEKWEANPKQTYFVTLILEEICMSIIRNALEKVPDGRIRVSLQAMENGDFMLHILDNAVVFNPFSLHARKMEKNHEFDIDAVSMMLIRTKAKEFMHRECQGFNSLVILI